MRICGWFLGSKFRELGFRSYVFGIEHDHVVEEPLGVGLVVLREFDERELGEQGVSLAINLDVPSSLVVERLGSRRVCQECGAVFSLLRDDPEAVSGTCSRCGGDVIQRGDDQPSAIETRLAAYERDTAPLLDFYTSRGLLVTIDGARELDTVTADIEAALAARGLA